MKFTSYTKNDNYYEFVGENERFITPVDGVIIVEENGSTVIKTVGSRKVLGYLVG